MKIVRKFNKEDITVELIKKVSLWHNQDGTLDESANYMLYVKVKGYPELNSELLLGDCKTITTTLASSEISYLFPKAIIDLFETKDEGNCILGLSMLQQKYNLEETLAKFISIDTKDHHLRYEHSSDSWVLFEVFREITYLGSVLELRWGTSELDFGPTHFWSTCMPVNIQSYTIECDGSHRRYSTAQCMPPASTAILEDELEREKLQQEMDLKLQERIQEMQKEAALKTSRSPPNLC